MVALGFENATCTVIGNAIGANQKYLAKRFFKVAMTTILPIFALISALLVAYSESLAQFLVYPGDSLDLMLRIIPIIAVFFVLDGLRANLEGVIKALSLQYVGAMLTFIAIFMILLPTAVYLAFIQEMGLVGFWLGSCIGLSVQVVFYLGLILSADWDEITDDVQGRLETQAELFGGAYDFGDRNLSDL